MVPDAGLRNFLDPGLVGNLLVALDAPNAVVVARATARNSAVKLRV
jgi:hypothetical protein